MSECYVKIGEHNGVLTCFVGTATCWDGEWGDCGGGELHSAASARNPGGFKSLGPPVPCLDNPCDPTCRHYDESPPVAWSADTDAGGDYLYTVKSETYEASCPDGETPQWSLFGYDTACPADSEVVFSVRTAESTQDLAAQPWVEVATA